MGHLSNFRHPNLPDVPQNGTHVKHPAPKHPRCPLNWDTCQIFSPQTCPMSLKMGHRANIQASVLPGVRPFCLIRRKSLNSRRRSDSGSLAGMENLIRAWQPRRKCANRPEGNAQTVPKGTRVKSPSGPKTNSRPEKRTTGPRTNNWPEK